MKLQGPCRQPSERSEAQPGWEPTLALSIGPPRRPWKSRHPDPMNDQFNTPAPTTVGPGVPVLREPASPVSAGKEGEAQAARREPRPWMAEANVRRRGMGDPEATLEPGLRVASLEVIRRRGRQKFRRSSEAPRHSSSVRRSPPRLRAGRKQSAQCMTLTATPKPRSGPATTQRANPSLTPEIREEVADLVAREGVEEPLGHEGDLRRRR